MRVFFWGMSWGTYNVLDKFHHSFFGFVYTMFTAQFEYLFIFIVFNRSDDTKYAHFFLFHNKENFH